MGWTPEELAAIPITPKGLRAVANRPCDGERTYVLRKTADLLDAGEAVIAIIDRMKDQAPDCSQADYDLWEDLLEARAKWL